MLITGVFYSVFELPGSNVDVLMKMVETCCERKHNLLDVNSVRKKKVDFIMNCMYIEQLLFYAEKLAEGQAQKGRGFRSENFENIY